MHRIGRTGRAGKKGLATAFFTDEDTALARPLNELLTETGQEVPGWLGNIAARSGFGGGKGRSGRGRFGGRDFRKDGGGGGGGCEWPARARARPVAAAGGPCGDAPCW